MHCSNKTQIASDMEADELYELVRTGLRGLVQSLPAQLRAEAEELDCVACVMRNMGPNLGGFSARRRPCAGEPTRRDVRAIKAQFEGQVITEIDKARGELAVL